MSLSRYLQSPEILAEIKGKDFDAVRALILEKGIAWNSDNREERTQIQANLEGLGLECTETLIDEIQYNIILHYAEKIFPLSGGPKQLKEFITEHIDTTEAEILLKEASATGGVLVATPHFGGVEFVVPTIASMNLNPHACLRFSTQNLSDTIQAFAEGMEASGEFAKIGFVEMGKPGVMAAMEMAKVLRNKEVLFTVFDEETDYSVPAQLFGKTVEGGAGLDKLIKFANTPMTVFNVFMVRVDAQNYKMVLKEVDLNAENPIQQMYTHLEGMLVDYLVQWYFLHEEVPFWENK